MDTAPSEDETYVPTRWLQVVSYLIFVNQDKNLRLCLLFGYKLYTTPQSLIRIIKGIITEKLELSVVDPVKLKSKVNSFLWLWLVHFLKEDFKAPRVRARLWELLDVTMTRDEQNRVKLLCLQGFSRKQSPAVMPTAVQAAMAREAIAAAAAAAAAIPTNETTPCASPSASPGVSRTPSTSSTISSSSTKSQLTHAPAELLRTNSSSSSSTSSSRRSSSGGSAFGITPVPQPPQPTCGSHISLLHFPHLKDLARQLTVYEMGIFKKVGPSEFYGSTTKGRKYKAPHLSRLVEISNKISGWIAFEIVSAPPAHRTKTLEAAIKLAYTCREMRNYNTAMEVHSSLCQSSVSRLRKAWAELSPDVKAMHQELDDLLNPISNFKAYRTELREIAADTLVRFATPILPYVGTFLRDVVFACDGNPDFIDLADGVKVMNFDRLHMVGSQIIYFNKFKVREYHYPAVSEVQEKLKSIPLYEEEVISQLSYQCEPQRNAPAQDPNTQ